MEIADVFSGGMKQLWKNPLLLLINTSVWLLVLFIITFLLSGVFPLRISVVFACFNVLLLLMMYYFNIYLVNLLLEKQRYFTYVLCFSGIFLIAVTIRIYFNLSVIDKVIPGVIQVSKQWVFLFSTFTTLIVLLISFFNGLLMTRSQKEKGYLAIIAHQRETQVEFLKTQMSPHFLFNTLNNIYSLTIDKAPKASEMILLLSDVLRYAVYKSKESKVDLTTEVGQIKKLLQLHALRSERKPAVTFTVDITSAAVFIEPMILIPLVENCFKHGNIETDPQAYIFIRLWEDSENILFETSNSRDQSTAPKNMGNGIGLKNIRERLSIRYTNRHSLEIKEKENSFSVLLQIKKTDE